MRKRDAFGAGIAIAFIFGVFVLVCAVAFGLHTTQMHRLSTAMEEPNDEAPVPVMYRLVEEDTL
jgi:hypothetical protein